ncbi:MAG: hypothetical protein A2342_05185 [Gallionellales bacterium RIFOXYB12_FULL_54_9]|nr:MAG: hypothetical protein A2342_05185 [Gallionellales bacterium RIFOXYB12_FULL_54_9]
MLYKTNSHELFLLILAGLLFSLPVSAKTYKWVDDKGVTHYGETIPPEYASKDRTLLNKSGIVVKTQEVLTADERRAKEAAEAKGRSDEAIARDLKRRDKSLIDSYNSVEEIELSRTRNLQQVDARINSINAQLKMDNNNLISLQKNTATPNSADGKAHVATADEIREAQARVQQTQQDLDKYKAEKLSINARYDADKVRYKELTGK